MHVQSELLDLPKDISLTSEEIESELLKRGINPIRWAIVNIKDDMYTISVANLKE